LRKHRGARRGRKGQRAVALETCRRRGAEEEEPTAGLDRDVVREKKRSLGG
jgi:hypothetical protein